MEIPSLEQNSQLDTIDSFSLKKIAILETLHKNITSDFEEVYTIDNIQKVLKFYAEVYEAKTRQKKCDLFNQLKMLITNPHEITMIEWFENQRSNKYNLQYLVTGKSTKACKSFNKIEICRTEINLIPSKFISHGNINSVKENASLDSVKIGSATFDISNYQTNGIQKRYLFRQNKNQNPNPTPWIVEKTKDHRYVWRGDIDLDRYDVEILLKFIFKSRDQLDECPSIVINAGSHGDGSGSNSNDSGMMQYSDLDIYDEIIDVIYRIIEKSQQLGLKVGKFNLKRKIYVHLVSLNIPCIYPENADHIIDVQCRGAYSKVGSHSLHPKNSPIIEEDLRFLFDSQKCPLKENSERVNKSTQIKKTSNDPINSKGQIIEVKQANNIEEPNNMMEAAKISEELIDIYQSLEKDQPTQDQQPIQPLKFSNPETKESEQKIIEFVIFSKDVNQQLTKRGPFIYDIDLDMNAIKPRQNQGGVYVGEVDQNGQPCGRGKFLWNDSSLYEGYWLNNRRNGRGRKIYSDGDVYEGQWKDCKRHGRGVLQHTNGKRYDGMWQQGYREGFGSEKYPGGQSYEGGYHRNLKHGKGKLIIPNDYWYEGQFYQNYLQGKGRKVWSDGKDYEGNWKMSQMHGYGVCKYPDGRFYRGYWKSSLVHGHGNCKYPDGKQYNGYYFQNFKEGFGVLTWPCGKIYEGKWKNDKQDGPGKIKERRGDWCKGVWKRGIKIL